jgi:hypothetical protein
MSREKPEAEPMAVEGLRLETISLRSEIRSLGPQLNSLRSSSSKNLTGQAGAGGRMKCLKHKNDQSWKMLGIEVIISPISFQVRQDQLFQDPLETLQL